jgi:hypothetical protein
MAQLAVNKGDGKRGDEGKVIEQWIVVFQEFCYQYYRTRFGLKRSGLSVQLVDNDVVGTGLVLCNNQ